MHNIKAVLFDYDGTLRDTGYVVHQSLAVAFKHHGITPPSLEEMAPYIHHHSHVQKQFAPHINKEEFDEIYYAHKKKLVASLELFEHTKQVLSSLKKAGLKVGLVTAMKADEISEEIAKHQFGNIFDVTVGGDEVKQHKPEPDSLLLAVKRLGLSIEEVVYVGDMITDAYAAQKAGLAGFVGITTGLATEEELKQAKSDYIISSLKDLPAIVASR